MKKIYVVFSVEVNSSGVRQNNGYYTVTNRLTYKTQDKGTEVHPCIDGTFSSKKKAQDYCTMMAKDMCERWSREWGEAWEWKKNTENKGWYVSAYKKKGGVSIKYYILPTELNNMNDFALCDIYSECDPF